MFDIAAPDFSLQTTLSSGQTFRWKEHLPAPTNGRQAGQNWYYGFIGSTVLKVRQDGDRVLCESSDPRLTPNRLRHYFALDLNMSEILSSIDVDMQIHEAILRHRGLRVLRQEGWETLASFICASFNNIKRIEGMIERLCQTYGDPVSLNGFRGFSFPSAERIARLSERQLRSVGLGYRAPYLRATARLVMEGRLSLAQLQQVDYRATKTALLGCDGVGEKVADCVALFGFEKYEAFPIDVWMERAMRYYFRHRKATRKRLLEYAQQHFGRYAGYAQQYLYHYIRNLRSHQ